MPFPSAVCWCIIWEQPPWLLCSCALEQLEQREEQICPDLLKGSRLLLCHSQLWFSFEEERREVSGRGRHPSLAAASLSHPKQVHPQPEAEAIPHSVIYCHARLIYPAQEIVKASHRHSWMYQAIVTVLGKNIRYVFFIETSKSCFSFSRLASTVGARISSIILWVLKAGKAGGSERWLCLK